MPMFNILIDREILQIAMERDEPVEINLRLEPPRGPNLPTPQQTRAHGPLASLMTSGLLSAGDRLILSQPRANRTATATVRADGGLEVAGKSGVFWSPSKAAGAITGSQINGWTLWRKESDGRTLDALRTQFDESEG
jgi:site-specific DNA-methyltransferase (adenine-specific)